MDKSKLLGVIVLIGQMLLISCTSEKLPIFGRTQIVEREEAGKTVYDSVQHTVANFEFINQDSVLVNNETFNDKVYVADFFFTSCPTICPKMKKQMLRIHDKFLDNDKVSILSHSIDPKHDSVAVLRDYAERLGVKSSKWHFVTGDRDEIFDIGERSYMVTAGVDENAPGGYLHSGAFLLVDMDRRIRGVYDGTLTNEVDVLLNDIEKLIEEYDAK